MVSLSRNRWRIILVNVCRWLLALVMMLSGLLKAVDPVGAVYKLQEYAAAFSLPAISDDWLLAVAIAQAAIEFLLGFYLLVGVYRRTVSFVALLAMLLFTPLSLYLWVSGAVSDCGCFGESVTLSNGATFLKNLLLLFFAFVVFWGRSLFLLKQGDKIRWAIVLFSLCYIFGLQSFCLSHLPLIDFGTYAVGNDLRSMVGAPLVDDASKGGKEGEQIEFSIIDWESDIELADELLADTGYVCIIPIERVESAAVTHIDKINDLYDYCTANNIRFCAVSSSGEEEVLLWEKRTGAEYPMFWADEVMLRSMLRSNPGLVLLKDGVIVGKWAAADIPSVEELEKSPTLMPDAVVSPYGRMKYWPFWLFLLCCGLILFSLFNVLMAGVDYRKNKKAAGKKTAEPVTKEQETSDIN